MSEEQFSVEKDSTKTKEFYLGEAAVGTIDPAERNLDTEKLATLEQDILGDRFDAPVMNGVILPCGCIDGRCPHRDEAFNLVPNASGGTLSLLVGEWLTNGSRVASSAKDSEEALASLITYLQAAGYGDQVGGHTGPAHGPNAESASGCGANDNLRAILGLVHEKPDVILSVLETLNVPVDTETVYPAMVAKARELTDREGFFANGKAVSETLKAASPDGNCPELQGGHKEVIIRLNTVEGTTLDRRALEEVYGDEYQVFNVDVWSLKQSAELLSTDENGEVDSAEAENRFAAMVIYQVATALQLCGPSMRVVVR